MGHHKYKFIDGEPNYVVINTLLQLASLGTKIYVVTSRRKTLEDLNLYPPGHIANRVSVGEFVQMMDLPVSGILYTNGCYKVSTLIKLKSEIHFDDNIDELDKIAMFSNIKPIHVTSCN